MSNEVIEVELTTVKELFYNEKSNFGVYACESPDFEKLEYSTYGNFSISGTMPKLTKNANYKAELEKKLHPKYGLTYEVKWIEKFFHLQ